MAIRKYQFEVEDTANGVVVSAGTDGQITEGEAVNDLCTIIQAVFAKCGLTQSAQALGEVLARVTVNELEELNRRAAAEWN